MYIFFAKNSKLYHINHVEKLFKLYFLGANKVGDMPGYYLKEEKENSTVIYGKRIFHR